MAFLLDFLLYPTRDVSPAWGQVIVITIIQLAVIAAVAAGVSLTVHKRRRV